MITGIDISNIVVNELKRKVCILPCLAFLFMFLLVYACQSDGIEQRLPARTVIVYMIADNNLDYFAQNDVNEMEQGWRAGTDGNLIVYLDRAEGASPAHPVVYKIEHDTTNRIVSSIVKIYREHNSADAGVMHQVLSDIIAGYPAQSYGLVLWSHGTAWLPASENMTFNSDKLRSFGRDHADEMDISDLKNAFPCHFDFIIFDACYMGAIEVVYELRNSANF